ncbi:MAG: SurA N-terminal domain-containing protein [Gammaproteobacteria bacterium]|nr:SurA N-terminal domain-containing protein [Gammaproteobacteria bacterium]MBU1653257.1 SurA N-terminal domain-containing protein [Gammaproteobacteria bacterium]MBU1962105.1 SurA N-terminal domain-containing protein [Gammaproteobacteria bacterium]
MLQTIRERAQGWIAWVIVILITIPFALWGIQEYLGVGGETVAAKVNGADITERELDTNFQRFRTQLRERLGASYKAGLIDDRLLRQQVLNSMVRAELLMQAAIAQNMQAPDAMVQQAIAAIPAFQKAGRFDYPSYEQGLRLQGLSPDIFFQRMRGNMVVDQLGNAIRESEFSTGREVDAFVRLRSQRRDIGYLLFSVDASLTDEKPAEAAVKEHYEGHRDAFMTPERVKLEYVELSAEELAAQVKADDQVLTAYLEGHADDFRLPEEYHARHILVTVKEGKEEEARAKAEKLLARVRGGEDFVQIAKKESEDPGSAEKGGDLGFFGASVMEQAFEKSVAGLKPGETSELVRTLFGFHIIQLLEKRGGGKADLAAVHDRVAAAYAKEEGQKLFYEKAERMADLAYENPTSLEPIVKGLGLPLKQSEWITRTGGEGSLNSPKVVNAAFSGEVLGQGNNSEAIELGQEHMLVLRAVNHENPAPRPLEEVRKEIEEALRRERAVKLAAGKGQKALERLKSGEAVDALAGEASKLEKPGLLDRFAQEAPPPVIREAFRLPRPAQDKPSLGSARLENGDFAVILVGAVQDGVADPKTGTDKIGAELAAGLGERYFENYVGALKERAKIEITPSNPKSE